MIKIYPKNEIDKNETIEEIIKDGLVIVENKEWGYMINVDSVERVNKMGYKLLLVKGGIIYEW